MFGIRKRRAPLFGSVAAEDDKDIEVQRARDVARHSLWAEARLLLRDLLFALMFAALLVVFVVQPVKVEGTSMLPRLHDGERIFVNKLIYYGLPELKRGDIVVFWFPDDPSKSYIKRIIGLPGEWVEIREGRIYIRSQGREQLLAEPYLDPQRNVGRANHAAVEVKQHYYFVMGDNRDASSDSRYWGLVPEKYIYGKALFRYWPLGSASFISHEPDSNVPPPSATNSNDSAAEDDER
jgi:signal peptidase I